MQLLASLIDGILIGFVYGVAAMGLTLIWGVMSVINLSHGPVMALGMFGAYFLFTSLGINPYLALIAVASRRFASRPVNLYHRSAPGDFGAAPFQFIGHLCR